MPTTTPTLHIPEGQTVEEMLSRLTAFTRKRGCIPIPIDFFTEMLPKLSEAEIRVYLYQLYKMLGFGKTNDSIASEQFIHGTTHRKGERAGKQQDRGCGLRSKKTVIKAVRSLQNRGLIKKSARSSKNKGDLPNHYQMSFVLHHVARPEIPGRKTQREGNWLHPQTASSKRNLQRCKNVKQKRSQYQFMDSAHVDFIVDRIEQVTGDFHSRGAFAEIAMTVPEGKIFELLSLLKDRGNINNKGAWFLASANTYQSPRIHKADETPLETVCDSTVSVDVKAVLLRQKADLVTKLGMPNQVLFGSQYANNSPPQSTE